MTSPAQKSIICIIDFKAILSEQYIYLFEQISHFLMHYFMAFTQKQTEEKKNNIDEFDVDI